MENKQFFIACKEKDFGLARKLFNEVDLQEKEMCFGFVCGDGYLEFAQWMVSEDSRINIHNHSEFPFRMACQNGHIDVCRWLWDISKKTVDITVYKNDPFRKACKYGHINIVKWLFQIYGKNKLNITYKGYSPFKNCCRLDNLDMAKLLLDTYKIPSSVVHDACLDAIKYRSVKTVELLVNLLEIQNEMLDKHEVGHIFSNLCSDGHPDTALWLIQLIPHLNFKHNYNEPFRICCLRQYIELALYLMAICDDYNLNVDDGSITKWWIDKKN